VDADNSRANKVAIHHARLRSPYWLETGKQIKKKHESHREAKISATYIFLKVNN